jgi:Protein of unknown function (DUF3306)
LSRSANKAAQTAQTAWSRRRAAVLAEAEAEQAEAQNAARAGRQAQIRAEQADKSDGEILAELNLKDPDRMQAGDDFAAFLRDEVPTHLRKRALRTLWRSNPVLACVDELVDYGNDFKAEALAAGVVKTAYRAGKGMLAHSQEMQRQRDAQNSPAPAKEAEAAEIQVTVEAETDDTGPVASDEARAKITPEPVPEMAEDPSPYNHRRRMRFEFGGVA